MSSPILSTSGTFPGGLFSDAFLGGIFSSKFGALEHLKSTTCSRTPYDGRQDNDKSGHSTVDWPARCREGMLSPPPEIRSLLPPPLPSGPGVCAYISASLLGQNPPLSPKELVTLVMVILPSWTTGVSTSLYSA
ncbi:hypothetical protein AAG570_001716 [Ranatra chinensis]|uniref:Uncharacterized protein n=1 Tax=Ranatra chinensis TaxID=642074 RepID=A0ABD0Y9B7_9HEMI